MHRLHGLETSKQNQGLPYLVLTYDGHICSCDSALGCFTLQASSCSLLRSLFSHPSLPVHTSIPRAPLVHSTLRSYHRAIRWDICCSYMVASASVRPKLAFAISLFRVAVWGCLRLLPNPFGSVRNPFLRHFQTQHALGISKFPSRQPRSAPPQPFPSPAARPPSARGLQARRRIRVAVSNRGEISQQTPQPQPHAPHAHVAIQGTLSSAVTGRSC